MGGDKSTTVSFTYPLTMSKVININASNTSTVFINSPSSWTTSNCVINCLNNNDGQTATVTLLFVIVIGKS